MQITPERPATNEYPPNIDRIMDEKHQERIHMHHYTTSRLAVHFPAKRSPAARADRCGQEA
jgi:hypothetical protein